MNLKKSLLMALVFVLGFSVSYVLRKEKPMSKGIQVDPTQRISILQIDPPTIAQPPELVVHSYSVDDKIVKLSDRDPSLPVWLIQLNGGRIVLGCSIR